MPTALRGYTPYATHLVCWGTSLAIMATVQMPVHCRGCGSIPGRGTEIARTMGRGKKKKSLVLLTSTFILVLLTFTRVKAQCENRL